MLCQNLTFSWRNLLEVLHFNPQDMESTKCEKERLAQKCHDLEMQLNLMKEEKSNLSGRFYEIFNGSQSRDIIQPAPPHKNFAFAINLVADVRGTWPQLIALITRIALATAFTPSDFMHTNQPARTGLVS